MGGGRKRRGRRTNLEVEAEELDHALSHEGLSRYHIWIRELAMPHIC